MLHLLARMCHNVTVYRTVCIALISRIGSSVLLFDRALFEIDIRLI
jgi:hypothetical protein